jgi:hypothetical protein
MMPSVTIRGEDAVAYLIDKYDWNIYGADYDRLNVIAYRYSIDRETGGTVNTYLWDNTFSVRMSMENYALIKALLRESLNGSEWYEQSWYEFDSWGYKTLDGSHNIILEAYRLSEAFRIWFDTMIIDYEMETK